MIALPPLLSGADHDTVIDAFPKVACTDRGIPGEAAGMTVGEELEVGPVPLALVAVTTNV